MSSTTLAWLTLSEGCSTLPVAWYSPPVSTTHLPLGSKVMDASRITLPLRVAILSTAEESLPLSFRVMGPPRTLPLRFDLAGFPYIVSFPLGVQLRHGSAIPLEGLLLDSRLLDRLPLTLPLGRSVLLTLDGETPTGIEPLPS